MSLSNDPADPERPDARASAPRPSWRSRTRLIALALGVAGSGAVAGALIAAHPTTGVSASTTAASASPTPSPSARPVPGHGRFALPCAGAIPGAFGAGRGTAAIGLACLAPGRSGTVTAINGSTLTLRTLSGTITVTTTSSTKYTREQRTVTRSAIRVGDVLSVRGARSGGTTGTPATSIAATAVTIVVPSVSGRIQSVSGSHVTLVVGDGQLVEVTTAGSTAYQGVRGASASAASLKAGVFIVAEGSRTDLTHLSADDIVVLGTMSFRGGLPAGGFPGGRFPGGRPSPSPAVSTGTSSL